MYFSASLGTSCRRPVVFVLRRYALPIPADSSVVLPQSLQFGDLEFERPTPKKHWWSDPAPLPFCAGYTAYRLRGYPTDWPEGWDSLAVLPDGEIDVAVRQGHPGSAIIFFSYSLMRHRPSEAPLSDRTLSSAEAAAAAQFKRSADVLATELADSTSPRTVVPPIDSMETDSWNDALLACKRMTQSGA